MAEPLFCRDLINRRKAEEWRTYGFLIRVGVGF